MSRNNETRSLLEDILEESTMRGKDSWGDKARSTPKVRHVAQIAVQIGSIQVPPGTLLVGGRATPAALTNPSPRASPLLLIRHESSRSSTYGMGYEVPILEFLDKGWNRRQKVCSENSPKHCSKKSWFIFSSFQMHRVSCLTGRFH